MKIMLVNPLIPKAFRMVEFADEEGKKAMGRRIMVGPPLALNELAGMVTEEDVIIMDQKTENDIIENYDPIKAFKSELENFKPDIVGVTCITAQFNSALKILQVTKKYNKEILTLVGGLHPTLCTEDFMNSDADLISIGIGKFSFKMIVEKFKKFGNKADFSDIPGLAINHGNVLEYTKLFCSFSYTEIKDKFILDTIMPNRKLTDKYDYIINDDLKIQYVSTSSGCTHKCNFCSIWQTTYGRYFHKSVDVIIDELKTMDKYDVIRFCDANTFGDLKKAKDLFTRIIEEGLNFHYYMADVRTDTVLNHPDIIELAQKAGLKIVVCGLEATSDEELKAYNKSNTVQNTSDALKRLNDLGILVNGNYIVKPDYVQNDFERMAEFVVNNPIFHSGFTILTPFPGTELWEEMKDEVVIHNYDYYNLTNAVTKTLLPEREFYRYVEGLYKTSMKSTGDYFRKYGRVYERKKQ